MSQHFAKLTWGGKKRQFLEAPVGQADENQGLPHHSSHTKQLWCLPWTFQLRLQLWGVVWWSSRAAVSAVSGSKAWWNDALVILFLLFWQVPEGAAE